MGAQGLQARGDILQLEHGVLKLPPQVCLPCSQGLRVAQYVIQGDFFALYLMPQLHKGREGHGRQYTGPGVRVFAHFQCDTRGPALRRD